MLNGDQKEVDECTFLRISIIAVRKKKCQMHLFEYGNKDSGVLHLLPLVLFTSRRLGEGMPGKETGGAISGGRVNMVRT